MGELRAALKKRADIGRDGGRTQLGSGSRTPLTNAAAPGPSFGGEGCLCPGLPQERIKFGRSRDVVPSKLVNPLYINKLEQILRVDGSPSAIPINPNLT